jgi:hypothetical protein
VLGESARTPARGADLIPADVLIREFSRQKKEKLEYKMRRHASTRGNNYEAKKAAEVKAPAS